MDSIPKPRGLKTETSTRVTAGPHFLGKKAVRKMAHGMAHNKPKRHKRYC